MHYMYVWACQPALCLEIRFQRLLQAAFARRLLPRSRGFGKARPPTVNPPGQPQTALVRLNRGACLPTGGSMSSRCSPAPCESTIPRPSSCLVIVHLPIHLSIYLHVKLQSHSQKVQRKRTWIQPARFLVAERQSIPAQVPNPTPTNSVS
ncbi:hypothetical protein GQ44DRAFT_83852 [Phaeosphaeriaceae sp. PMI808]|nr:hypothetical protein GQ44DRAFT_83852 [Phaeosphaeriaceae sp. PMI808]